MHRHGYQGRKLGRERDQRSALLKGLAESLILNETIETTLPKAKEAVKYTEKLITKAKVGTLHARRQVLSKLSTIEATNKLVDDIAPKLTARNSGHLRVKKTGFRRGDNAEMAKISFVDDLSVKKVELKTPKPVKPSVKAVKKPSAKAKKLTSPAKSSKKPQEGK